LTTAQTKISQLNHLPNGAELEKNNARRALRNITG